MNNVRIGITKTKLDGTFKAKYPSHDPIGARVFFFDDAKQPALLIQTDFCYLSVSAAQTIRQTLAEFTGIPADRIVIHSTHNHTSPEEVDMDLTQVAQRLTPAVIEAKEHAQPATMAYTEIDTGRQFNINRRKNIPGLGTFTLWLGYRDVNGQPDGGPMLRARLAHWQGKPVTDPALTQHVFYDGPTDGLIQAVFFKTGKGQPLGNLVRYTAHACIAGHTTKRHYSADYPGVLMRRLENEFGGIAAFLSGPCGNVAPWEHADWTEPSYSDADPQFTVPWVPHKDPNSVWKEIERIGNALADALIPHLPRRGDYSPCTYFGFLPTPLTLPVRNDLADDADQARQKSKVLKDHFALIRKTASLPELKIIADRINFYDHHDAFYNFYRYLTAEQRKAGAITAHLPAFRINDVILMGFPAEVFWETPQPAFQHAAEQRLRFISFTEANGDIGYIPTEDQRNDGDYECMCSILAPGAETIIRDTAVKVVALLENNP